MGRLGTRWLSGGAIDTRVPSASDYVLRNFIGGGWQIEKAAVPIQIVPKEFRDSFTSVDFRDGIAKAVSFATSGDLVGIEQPDLIFALQGKMYPQLGCHRVWGELSPTEFDQLVSAVTNRILDFSLKVEEENPTAGEAPPNSEPVPHDKLVTLVQNTFFAPVGAIAQNSEHFNQTVSLGISPQELQKFATEFSNHLVELSLDGRNRGLKLNWQR